MDDINWISCLKIVRIMGYQNRENVDNYGYVEYNAVEDLDRDILVGYHLDISGYPWISWLDIFHGDVAKRYPISPKVSIEINSYPFLVISYHVLRYPKISFGANSQMILHVTFSTFYQNAKISLNFAGIFMFYFFSYPNLGLRPTLS